MEKLYINYSGFSVCELRSLYWYILNIIIKDGYDKELNKILDDIELLVVGSVKVNYVVDDG